MKEERIPDTHMEELKGPNTCRNQSYMVQLHIHFIIVIYKFISNHIYTKKLRSSLDKK